MMLFLAVADTASHVNLFPERTARSKVKPSSTSHFSKQCCVLCHQTEKNNKYKF